MALPYVHKYAPLVVSLFAVLGFCMGQGVSDAAVVNAATCSIADINTAITAANPGDTVHLPTCTQTTWTSTVNITKAIILEGNGAANTILQRSQVAAGYESNPMFKITGVSGFEMRNMTLDGTGDTNLGTWVDMAIWLSNAGQFRIHHMTIQWFGVCIQIHGDPLVQRGVIDHNTIQNCRTAAMDAGDAYGYGVDLIGSDTYPALDLGSSQNVFIEDNTFFQVKTATAGSNGARYVFRHNTVNQTEYNNSSLDMHGYTGTTWPHGGRQYEIYDNVFDMTQATWTGTAITGGDGVIFNNQYDPLYTRDIAIGNACGDPAYTQDRITSLYIWNNTLIGGGTVALSFPCPAEVVLNTDYFTVPRPGYTSYTYPHPLVAAVSAVTITSPTSNATYATGTATLTTLAGTADDPAGIASVAWSCDVCGSGAATGTTSWSVPSITLLVGTNVITVTATKVGGGTLTDSLTVTYSLPDITTGLIMWLKLDDGSGTTAADSSSGALHPGTLSGGATWVAGQSGTAVAFNGTSGQIVVAGLLGSPAAVTLAAWVKLPTTPTGPAAVLSIGDDTAIRIDPTALVGMFYQGGSVWNELSATLPASTAWRHLAYTMKANEQVVYIDGVAAATGTLPGPISYTAGGANTVIAQHANGLNWWLNGTMDDVRVYNRALASWDMTLLATPPAALNPVTILRVIR